jgi:hypothetical protein
MGNVECPGRNSDEGDVAGALRTCEPGDRFVLNLKGSSWQIRFQVEPDGGIRIELPVEEFVKLGDELSGRQLEALRGLGWAFPGGRLDSSPVYVASGPLAADEASRVAMRTLADVLNAELYNLGYEAFRRGGESFTPPGMVRPRMPRDPATWFPSEPKVAGHWAYIYVYRSEDTGGGWASGEFVLLTDGRLFRRAVRSQPFDSRGQQKTVWIAYPWDLHATPKRLKSVAEAQAYLVSDGYELHPPSPVPAGFTSGEYSP